jgi:hypothetical protein
MSTPTRVTRVGGGGQTSMFRRCAAACVLAVALSAAAVSATSEVHQMHGSGTTNPSKFFWKVMDILEERARTPITMTYRAVGRNWG